MARHRRMAAPINSIKHFVPRAELSVTAGTTTNIEVIDAVIAPAAANVFDVHEGAVIKAVYVELWIISAGTVDQTTQFVLTIEKVPAGQTPAMNTNQLNLQAYLNKKNILYTTQGIVGTRIAGAPTLPIIRTFVLIPKGKQRFGLGDRFFVNISSVSTVLRVCGMNIYKEYN